MQMAGPSSSYDRSKILGFSRRQSVLGFEEQANDILMASKDSGLQRAPRRPFVKKSAIKPHISLWIPVSIFLYVQCQVRISAVMQEMANNVKMTPGSSEW